MTPIKRGTARRLGLDLPPPDLVVHLEFDVDRLNRALSSLRLTPVLSWQADFLASLHGMRRAGEGRYVAE